MSDQLQKPEIKIKERKKRQMTPELLDKLRMARERCAELRASAKELKVKMPNTIPEVEKTKVAKYLATRKAIHDKIKEEVELEIKDEKNVIVKNNQEFALPEKNNDPPPPLPKPKDEFITKNKAPTNDVDSDDEYTTIKVPKKKIIKWKENENKKELIEKEKEKEIVKPSKPIYSPYGTNHLLNLAMSGYKF